MKLSYKSFHSNQLVYHVQKSRKDFRTSKSISFSPESFVEYTFHLYRQIIRKLGQIQKQTFIRLISMRKHFAI